VVGHTDMKGKLGYNMDLSQRRARAVVTALTNDYGIASSRLEPQGVGPLVPVMTNQQDGGRAKNRRVELVER
jgi:OOP family OmpA-OmpF porin